MRKLFRRGGREGLTGEETALLMAGFCLLLLALAMAWTERELGIPLGEQLAALLGLSIHVTEYKPFLTGLSRCGQRLNGDHDVRFVWSVVVRGQRVLRFRCGASVPGERLLDFARREDLECLLRLYAPAHTVLIIGYEE